MPGVDFAEPELVPVELLPGQHGNGARPPLDRVRGLEVGEVRLEAAEARVQVQHDRITYEHRPEAGRDPRVQRGLQADLGADAGRVTDSERDPGRCGVPVCLLRM